MSRARSFGMVAAAILAAASIERDMPLPRIAEERKPSGKDRSKVKAARKQRKGAKP